MKSESKLQQEIVMWFRNNYCLDHHKPKHLIWSVPNETRNTQELMQKKQTGLLKGVADLCVALPNAKLLFIEVKTDTNKQQSEQIKFEKDITNLGFQYFVVRNLEEFQQIIRNIK